MAKLKATDYNRIADNLANGIVKAISDLNEKGVLEFSPIVEKIADSFIGTNPKYDRSRFIKGVVETTLHLWNARSELSK